MCSLRCLPRPRCGKRLQVEALLESIPRMFAATQVMETCAGAAIKSAVEALKGGTGGKVRRARAAAFLRCCGLDRTAHASLMLS